LKEKSGRPRIFGPWALLVLKPSSLAFWPRKDGPAVIKSGAAGYFGLFEGPPKWLSKRLAKRLAKRLPKRLTKRPPKAPKKPSGGFFVF
jgi:hypothetical protein